MQRDIHQDVLNKLEQAVEFYTISPEEGASVGADITEENPVQCVRIPGGWRVYISKELNNMEQAEAAAYELGRLLLKAEGLYLVNLGENWIEEYLARSMNDVIIDHFVVERLRADYAIGNDLMVKLKRRVLENAKELIAEYEDETTMLYGVGLRLLNLASISIEDEYKVEEVINLSDRVKKAYQLGDELLIYPEHTISPEEQWSRISKFLEKLGYDAEKARLSQ